MIASESLSADKLSCEILAHLRDEEVHLRQVIQQLADIRQALRSGRLTELASDTGLFLEAEGPSIDASTIRSARKNLQERLAQFDGVPVEQATISRFVSQLTGPLKSSILTARQRIVELSAELERLSRQNTMVVVHVMRSLQDAIQLATGSIQLTPSYGNEGKLSTQTNCSSFMMEI